MCELGVAWRRGTLRAKCSIARTLRRGRGRAWPVAGSGCSGWVARQWQGAALGAGTVAWDLLYAPV